MNSTIVSADDAARALIVKVRDFAATLDDLERSLFAALLAPGVHAAWDESDDAGSAAGWSATWSADRLPAHLAAAVRDAELKIVVDPA